MTCASREVSDQSGNLPRVFAVHFMGSQGPNASSFRTAKTLIRLGECACWSESLLVAHFVGFIMLGLIYKCNLSYNMFVFAFCIWKFIHINQKNLSSHACIIWAMSWENLFMPYANNKDADQPAYLCSLIRFVVRCLDSIIYTSICYSRNFKTLASFISWAGRFES